jgi:hypothetical protein
MSAAATGAFAGYARQFFDAGLFVTPTAGQDGKRPILKGYQKRRLGPDEIDAIAARHPHANLAIVTGLSKVAVIDVDDASDQALYDALDRFGKSPLIVKTAGRGGHQIYYRGNPSIRPLNFRSSEGVPMELRVDGNIVVAPPSKNPMTGRHYEFVTGSIEDVADLPAINTSSLPQIGVTARLDRKLHEDVRRRIEVGERNNWLFGQCLRHAPACDDFVALLDVAQTRNEDYFGEPLGDSEVVKTARSAWRYQEESRNWVGSAARLVVTKTGLLELAALGADALLLACLLRLEHGARMARSETFALDTRAMESADTIPGWSRSRYQRTIKALLEASALTRVRRGTARGDPSQYRIVISATSKGA